jgi:succinate-semialdehyde dehydrogenase / glutarate-semialdehyde dehydrogenase
MINSALLPRVMGYIDGRWTAARSGAVSAVIDPATGARLADVPVMGAAEAEQAVLAAGAAMRHVPPPPPELRRRQLRQIADLLLEHKQELGRIITLENGKPLVEAVVEVEYAAGFFEHFAAAIEHLRPRELEQRARGCVWTVHHRPAGVAGIITPWNFPLAMLAKKLSAALAAGCACVVKPAPATPLSAIALWHLFERMGLQPGRCNLVLGDAEVIGRVLCTHPAVRVISFTGSTAVGKLLAQQAGPHLKRLALELGGNAPFLVFADADVPAAVEGLIANKFRAGGQTCVCANRVYVHTNVHDRFVQQLAAKVAVLRVGHGLNDGVDIGPLINRAAWRKVDRHVRDAMARGAKRLVGEDSLAPASDYATFYAPTLLTGITSEMLVCREETFGPVVAVGTFDSEAQAIELANATEAGLAAYIYTDPRAAQRIVGQLHFGHVAVNSGTGPAPHAPFGGMKDSGYGREGGLEGLLEFTETQAVAAVQ